jgi:hypothetical protein
MAERNDNYYTPQYLADWGVQHAVDRLKLHNPEYGKEKSIILLEPGCGTNAPFANAGGALGCNVVAVENRKVHEGPNTPFNGQPHLLRSVFCQEKDFLNSEEWMCPPRQFNIIATNPPFSKAEKFVWKSLELLHPWGVMIFLLKLTFLASLGRMRLYQERPPSEVIIFHKRPSFTGNGNTDMTEYAFYVWDGAAAWDFRKANVSEHPTLKWLDTKGLKEKAER